MLHTKEQNSMENWDRAYFSYTFSCSLLRVLLFYNFYLPLVSLIGWIPPYHWIPPLLQDWKIL